MHLILFGFKGSGKTYFGKLAAASLCKKFIDTDEIMIQEYTKQTGHRLSIRQLYQTLGEIGFRKLEAHAVQNLTARPHAVIALGGGTVLNPDLVDFLQKMGKLVYLKASFNTVQKRIFQGELPSFIDANHPMDSLFKIYQKRILLYESIPAQQIDTDQLNPSEIVTSALLAKKTSKLEGTEMIRNYGI